MNGYRMRLFAAKKSLEVFIYGDIGFNWFSNGVTAEQFAKDLKDAGEVSTINLRINSGGGDVADGLAIYNTLRRHKARKEVDIDGIALSIASIVAMAGDEIRMANNAMFMIHDPWMGFVGNADDFRKQADIMDQFKEGMVSTYMKKSGADEKEIWDMMSEETWMTASEAVEHGFVDSVTEPLELAAHFDVKRFKNVPDFARSRISSSVATPRLDQYRTRMSQMEKRLRTSLPANS